MAKLPRYLFPSDYMADPSALQPMCLTDVFTSIPLMTGMPESVSTMTAVISR